MDWLKYIPLVGSAVGGIVDLFGGGSSDSPSKPTVQRARPVYTPLQTTQAPAPVVSGPQQAAMVTPQAMRMQAAQAKLDQLRAQRAQFAPQMQQGVA